VTVLKPQDVAVVLQLCREPLPRPPYSRIAAALSLSASEVHAAVKRARKSSLLHGPELGERPNLSAIEEFLFHGLKYAFPAERGEPARGVPTSYAAAPLRQLLAPSEDPPPVWPHPSGSKRGVSFQPLYKQAPTAALRDSGLYELLALVDALRDGRARERKLAEELILARLRPAAHA
jgi:DNA-binding Lrp family transcriptional regulator